MQATFAEHLSRPLQTMAKVTAGLKCAPDTDPSANTMHINAAATENAEAWDPLSTFRPTVRTSMNVPMYSLNSFESVVRNALGCISVPSKYSSGRHTRNATAATPAATNST